MYSRFDLGIGAFGGPGKSTQITRPNRYLSSGSCMANMSPTRSFFRDGDSTRRFVDAIRDTPIFLDDANEVSQHRSRCGPETTRFAAERDPTGSRSSRSGADGAQEHRGDCLAGGRTGSQDRAYMRLEALAFLIGERLRQRLLVRGSERVGCHLLQRLPVGGWHRLRHVDLGPVVQLHGREPGIAYPAKQVALVEVEHRILLRRDGAERPAHLRHQVGDRRQVQPEQAVARLFQHEAVDRLEDGQSTDRSATSCRSSVLARTNRQRSSRPSAAARRRHSASRSAETSLKMTRPSGPTRSSAPKPTSPSPVPTSSSTSPSRTAARSSTPSRYAASSDAPRVRTSTSPESRSLSTHRAHRSWLMAATVSRGGRLLYFQPALDASWCTFSSDAPGRPEQRQAMLETPEHLPCCERAGQGRCGCAIHRSVDKTVVS